MSILSPDFPLDTMDEPKERYAALDSLRGIAALAVALHHLQVASHVYFLSFTRNSYLFVEFFFVLSGFVITHAYHGKIRNRAGLLNFTIKRIGRVWPLHVTMLALFILAETALFAISHAISMPLPRAPFSEDRTIVGIPINFLMLNGIFPYLGAAWNAPSWSVSVELVAYLCFGFTSLLRNERLILIVHSSIILAAFLALTLSQTILPVERCLYAFFVGACVWRIRSLKLPGRVGGTVLEVVAVLLMVLFLSFHTQRFQIVLAPPFFAMIIFVFSREAGQVSSWLKRSIPLRLGLTSYSIYMVHFFLAFALTNIIKVGGKVLQKTWTLPGTDLAIINQNAFLMDFITIVYVMLCIGFAQLTYAFVEKPCYNWVRTRFTAAKGELRYSR